MPSLKLGRYSSGAELSGLGIALAQEKNGGLGTFVSDVMDGSDSAKNG
jgi:hypothetical protein